MLELIKAVAPYVAALTGLLGGIYAAVKSNSNQLTAAYFNRMTAAYEQHWKASRNSFITQPMRPGTPIPSRCTTPSFTPLRMRRKVSRSCTTRQSSIHDRDNTICVSLTNGPGHWKRSCTRMFCGFRNGLAGKRVTSQMSGQHLADGANIHFHVCDGC